MNFLLKSKLSICFYFREFENLELKNVFFRFSLKNKENSIFSVYIH